MPPPANLRRRYWRLLFFFLRVLLTLWVYDLFLPRVLRLGWVRAGAPARHERLAVRFRELAVEMGGVMIKLGQFLSARVDVLPPEVTRPLSGLQDEVPAVPWPLVEAQLVRELGHPPDRLFAEFQPHPHASASLGQVHLARLPDGRPVAVKVQRPGIRAIIETDLAVLRQVIRWLKLIGFIRRRADLDALYAEFATSLQAELDYVQEAANARRFIEQFADDPAVYVPSPLDELTSRRVLVMERIEGIKITDFAGLEAAGISRRAVARTLFRTYLKQIFEDGFFHADPHPGNLFILPDDTAPVPDEGRPFVLVFVDFGMVGEIPPDVRQRLRAVLVAVVQHDFRRLVELAKELHFLLPSADDEEVARAFERLFQRFYGLSLGELQRIDLEEIALLMAEFRSLLYHFPFQVPQNFILLGRCLGILSGLATSLDPDFSPVEEIEPFARRLIGEGASTHVVELIRLVTAWLLRVWHLPEEVEATLRFMRTAQVSVRLAEDDLLLQRLVGVELAVRQLADSLFLAVLVFAGWLIVSYVPWLAWGLWGFALLFGGYWVLRRIGGG
ncbi:MAG: AarF/ABC1/UbiB kinase family protein [Ardenticatenia bacterium]|nr:AarF/ABC1/UbiB kinase family protein [Ardenticatenia bacterium]